MIDVLTIMNNEMEKLKIPYTFDTWDTDITLPQFIGEISETPSLDEDGKSEYTFILTGYATNYTYLLSVAEQLKTRYKPSAVVDGLAIIYNSCNNNITNDSYGSSNIIKILTNIRCTKFTFSNFICCFTSNYINNGNV